MPSFYVPARDSRHRAACFALYRALLRQVPHIALPAELTSRPDWINPIRYLVRSGFRRNSTDTSPRLVTSALTSGYRFLTLLARARDAASPSHADVLAFLLARHRAFPPPRLPAPPPARPPPVPLLTKISAPGQSPLYASTARPLPLAQFAPAGDRARKVPQFELANGIPFLRIGKPMSHAHANFLRRKSDRRQARITALIDMQHEGKAETTAEDLWEAQMERLARAEGVNINDVPGGGDQPRGSASGSFHSALVEFGIKHVDQLLHEEVEDMQARTTAMLDIIEEEEKLAIAEKKEKDLRRRRAWEEKVRQQEARGHHSRPKGSRERSTIYY